MEILTDCMGYIRNHDGQTDRVDTGFFKAENMMIKKYAATYAFTDLTNAQKRSSKFKCVTVVVSDQGSANTVAKWLITEFKGNIRRMINHYVEKYGDDQNYESIATGSPLIPQITLVSDVGHRTFSPFALNQYKPLVTFPADTWGYYHIVSILANRQYKGLYIVGAAFQRIELTKEADILNLINCVVTTPYFWDIHYKKGKITLIHGAKYEIDLHEEICTDLVK